MKAKDKKRNSILMLLLLLVCIAGVSVMAYIACTKVGQGQSETIDQNATVEAAPNEEDKTKEPSQEEENQKEETTDSTKDQQQTDDQENVEDSKETADEETTDENDKEPKPGFFERNRIKLGLDLQGGVNIVYEAQIEEDLSEEKLAEAMQGAQALVQRRLDSNGYTEAQVAIEGSKRLRVDIPGVEDPQKAINEIGAAGMLYFYGQDYMQDPNAKPILTGKNIKSARAAQNTQTGEYVVSIQMNSEGTKIFDEYTGSHQGEYILIFLDDQLLSMATLSAHIVDGKGEISGSFTAESAKALADGINAGALPFTLQDISATGVGAQLGADALRTSILAGIIGFILIMIFMIGMYRLCGVAADIALVLYVGLVILTLTAMNATLTLPGIAGILLSIGMAVDANVIIFARIKEELDTGKTVRLAVQSGFDKAFKAIIDGNVTTLIAAVVLFAFGTGLIKSFATTLMIGIVVSMFTALLITRFVLKAFIGMNIKKASLYARPKKLGKEA